MITKELQEFAKEMELEEVRTDETGEENSLSVGTFAKGFLVIQAKELGKQVFYIEDGIDPHANNMGRLVGVKNLIAFGKGFFA